MVLAELLVSVDLIKQPFLYFLVVMVELVLDLNVQRRVVKEDQQTIINMDHLVALAEAAVEFIMLEELGAQMVALVQQQAEIMEFPLVMELEVLGKEVLPVNLVNLLVIYMPVVAEAALVGTMVMVVLVAQVVAALVEIQVAAVLLEQKILEAAAAVLEILVQ